MSLAAVVVLALASGPPAWGPGRLADLAEASSPCAVKPGESLIEIARRYDLGYREIADANPTLDPFLPGTGVLVRVPAARILPAEAAPGRILVNLSERRLYYGYRRPGDGLPAVLSFPVGVARKRWPTPLGSYTITAREVNPAWRVPPSILRERPGLPGLVPPGPDDPLGTRALRLSGGDILIHGTNRPWGVGRRVSHGCVHLYPEDILKLFPLTRLGTTVLIVREPIKACSGPGGRVYVEVHADPDLHLDYLGAARSLLASRGLLGRVDPHKLLLAVGAPSGIPTDVSD